MAQGSERHRRAWRSVVKRGLIGAAAVLVLAGCVDGAPGPTATSEPPPMPSIPTEAQLLDEAVGVFSAFRAELDQMLIEGDPSVERLTPFLHAALAQEVSDSIQISIDLGRSAEGRTRVFGAELASTDGMLDVNFTVCTDTSTFHIYEADGTEFGIDSTQVIGWEVETNRTAASDPFVIMRWTAIPAEEAPTCAS